MPKKIRYEVYLYRCEFGGDPEVALVEVEAETPEAAQAAAVTAVNAGTLIPRWESGVLMDPEDDWLPKARPVRAWRCTPVRTAKGG